MILPLAIALAPTVFSRSFATIDGFTSLGPVYIEDQSASTYRNIDAPEVVITNCQGISFGKSYIHDSDKAGITLIRCKDINIFDTRFARLKFGIEGGPGHPWSFEDWCQQRGLIFHPESKWVLGMNTCGMIETRNKGISWVGDGKATKRFDFDADFYKLDYLPLSMNAWRVSGKTSPRVVAEDAKGFTLGAEGVFKRGQTYWAHTWNPVTELKDVTVDGNTFEDISVACVSLYFTDGARIIGNDAQCVTSDYRFGLEHARNGVVERNTGIPGSGNIGLLGLLENIVVKRNTLSASYMSRNQPVSGVVSDKPMGVNQESPWVR